jgi:striatin 1/3/4
MNPLPNRPLLNNSSLPLSLPNVPSFDQMSYNGRPRKVMPEAGKDFPILNGISLMSGPSSAPTTSGSQIPPLERGHPINTGILHPQQHQPQPPPPQAQQANQPGQQQSVGQPQSHLEKDKDGESEPKQLTAIFRPDDAGDWKEKLRQSHEASEQARLGSLWDRRSRYDDEEGKEEEGEIEDEDSNVVGEGEDTKVWKTKRTLRK